MPHALKEVRTATSRVYLDLRFEKDLDGLGLKTGEDFKNPATAAMLLRDLGVRRNYRIAEQGRVFYLKVHEEKNYRQKESRGRREWNNHLRLSRVGIPCPVPVAWGEGKSFSFFMSLALDGVTGEELAPRWNDQTVSTRRRLCCDLAHQVARLHRVGYFIETSTFLML